ncbi:MAG: thioredoxin family protein [Ignavibacteriales bacterium]|nr:thioredoxin family protein [Ignavibacteriales bacterium]
MTTQPLHTGASLPPFHNLPGVDGKNYSSSDFTSDILIIAFTCNHCPYVQAYEERMIALQREYSSKGVLLVAINSNEEQNYPEDSFENMVKRAKQNGFNFSYLRDGDQSVATSFGATHTPQFFLFNKKRTLCYSGKLDDNWKEPRVVKEHYLRDAIEALLSGNDVPVKETYSIGCTIKWR